MSGYQAEIRWTRDGAPMTRYSRAHRWHFDGGTVVPASASPAHVPAGCADPAGVDPEEAFVAAIASCHMLWFLALAARQGLIVEQYEDAADGERGPDADGRQAMTRVTLRPHVLFAGGTAPSRETLHALHHAAHEACYLANSVRTPIEVCPE